MTAQEAAMIVGMALVTFLIRYPVLALVGRIELPRQAVQAMRFIPPAVLTAIIVPALLMPNGSSLQVSVSNAYLIAGVVAALTAWRTRNLLLTIVLGMATLWLWRWLLVIWSTI